MKPVVVDHEGLISLSSILTSEEKLLALVIGCPHTMSPLPQIHIPNRKSRYKVQEELLRLNFS